MVELNCTVCFELLGNRFQECDRAKSPLIVGVDALTGQDLNRWFPLTAPSDFLYFLPPRRGIDSAKKLRLISSAVHPREASPLTKRFGVTRGSLASWGTWEPKAGQSDHFQAVPLSDGYHILFMDPETGRLCLGSDAPLGSVHWLLYYNSTLPLLST